MPPGVALTRASKAWGFNSRGILAEYANDAPVFDYDPALLYNALVDPGALGGTVGGALPPGWTAGGVGLAATLVARGTTDDGLPFHRIRLAGTTSGTNAYYMSPCALANRECPIVVGETFAAWARVALIEMGQPLGAMTVTARLTENNDSFAVTGSTILATLALGQPQVVQGARTATNAGTTNGSIAIVLAGYPAGQVVDVTVEFVFPVVTRGARPATDYATPQALAATDANGRTYGRRGLLTEPATTNMVPNPRWEGAVAGTPGTTPSSSGFWTPDATSGLTRTIAVGTEGGFPTIDFRYAGTTTAANVQIILGPAAASAAPAVVGETWIGSLYARVAAGALPAAPVLRMQEQGAAVFTATDTTMLVDGRPLAAQRFISRRTFTQADVVNAQMMLILVIPTSGTVVDFTLRLAGPQIEKQPCVTSLVLPPAGTPAASTRALSQVDASAYTVANMAGDVERIMELSMELAPGTTGGMFWATGVSTNERDELYLDAGGTGQVNYQAFRGGVRRINSLFSPAGANQRRFLTVAIQQKRNAYAASYLSGTPTTFAQDFDIPGVATLLLGRQNSAAQVAGWIRSFRHWHEAADRIDLVKVGALPDDGTGDPRRNALVKVQAGMADLFGSLVAAPAIGTGAPTPAMGASAGFPQAATYLDAGQAIWWASLAAQDNAARWAPLGTIDHPGYISGRWYGGNINSLGQSHILPANQMFLTPQYIAHAVTITQLSFRSGFTGYPGSGSARIGIYASATGSAEARDLVVEHVADVTVNAANTQYIVTLATPVTIVPGVYWFALVCNSGTISFLGEGHGGVLSGGPALLRGAQGDNVRGSLATSQFANTACKTMTRSLLAYTAGAAFFPTRLHDLIQGANTPASPLFFWKAA